MFGEEASQDDWHIYLADMIACCYRIASDVSGIDSQDVSTESVLYRALLHDLAIIGEAANKIPKEVCEIFSNIPWPRVIALRNRIIHNYGAIASETIWQTIQESVPDLLAKLLEMQDSIQRRDG